MRLITVEPSSSATWLPPSPPKIFISSFPVRLSGGNYEIVEGLEIGDFAQGKLDITVGELKEERDAVKRLGLI